MKTGIDTFLMDSHRIIKGRNFALVTGSSNVDSKGIPVYMRVKEVSGGNLKSIWSLQHGFFIDKQDNMIFSDSFFWKDMEIEIKSLYGKKVLPDDHWLDGIDAVLVDIFDVGTRVYTFVNHLVMIMKWLSGKNVPMIVLDRPNPLNGLDAEGNVIEKNYYSIVGQLPVPMRHCLTIGEYLSFGLSTLNLDVELEVVKVKHWNRNQWFKGTWTYPSPNMPGFKTAIVYPGSVMLEGTNISEGRGTTRPFELVGAPFIDNFEMVKRLEKLNLPGTTFTPIFFKPEFSKFQSEVCKGILVTPSQPEIFESFSVYYEIIRYVFHAYKEKFQWKQPPYEFEYKRPPIDMISGSPFIREAIENNRPFNEMRTSIDDEIKKYKETVVDFLLYT